MIRDMAPPAVCTSAPRGLPVRPADLPPASLPCLSAASRLPLSSLQSRVDLVLPSASTHLPLSAHRTVLALVLKRDTVLAPADPARLGGDRGRLVVGNLGSSRVLSADAPAVATPAGRHSAGRRAVGGDRGARGLLGGGGRRAEEHRDDWKACAHVSGVWSNLKSRPISVHLDQSRFISVHLGSSRAVVGEGSADQPAVRIAPHLGRLALERRLA